MPLYLVSQLRLSPGELMPRIIITRAIEAGDAKLANKTFRGTRVLPPTDTTFVKNLDTHQVCVFS